MEEATIRLRSNEKTTLPDRRHYAALPRPRRRLEIIALYAEARQALVATGALDDPLLSHLAERLRRASFRRPASRGVLAQNMKKTGETQKTGRWRIAPTVLLM